MLKLRIKSIECIEVRQFYDSTWKIEFEDGMSCVLTRYDFETEQELRKAIMACDSVEDVKALDMRNKIRYD
jgi:hypothetical protein